MFTSGFFISDFSTRKTGFSVHYSINADVYMYCCICALPSHVFVPPPLSRFVWLAAAYQRRHNYWLIRTTALRHCAHGDAKWMAPAPGMMRLTHLQEGQVRDGNHTRRWRCRLWGHCVVRLGEYWRNLAVSLFKSRNLQSSASERAELVHCRIYRRWNN